MGSLSNRADLVKELEGHFNKRIFLICYNYAHEPSEGDIKLDDEFYFRQFREDVLKKENVSQCILILSGLGGNVKTAIACSQILRDCLIRYDCFVPTVAGSSLCYFILQSDRLLIGEKSIITQIDPLFVHEGREYRAIEYIKDKDLHKKAKEAFNPTIENLKRVFKEGPNVFENSVIKESLKRNRPLGRMVDSWMKQEEHTTPIKKEELKKLGVKFKVIPEEIIDKAKELINECIKELIDENRRFVIQTNKIEDGKYFGGYFHE